MKILLTLISIILIGQLAKSQFIIKDSTIVGFDKFILGTHKSVFEKQLKPVVYKNDANPGEKMYQYFFLKNESDSLLEIKIDALCLFFDKYDSLIRVALDFSYRNYKRPHYKKEAKTDFEKVKSTITNLLNKKGELKLIPKINDYKQYNWTNNSVFVFTNFQRGTRTRTPSLDRYTILLQISYRD
jgi:hypothetical protein